MHTDIFLGPAHYKQAYLKPPPYPDGSIDRWTNVPLQDDYEHQHDLSIKASMTCFKHGIAIVIGLYRLP